MTSTTTPAADATIPAPVDAGSVRARASWWRRLWRRPLVRWLASLLAVLALVLVTIAVLLGSANAQKAGDPRSNRRGGTGGLAQLLTDEGVTVVTTGNVSDAATRSNLSTTLVVANANRLSQADARSLFASPHARLVLLSPDTLALRAFDLPATAEAPQTGQLEPGCADPEAVRAGRVVVDDMRASYRGSGPVALACYPAGGGYGYLRLGAGPSSVDLVAGGLTNHTLGVEGNAAFAMAVLGSQPNLVWLMSPVQSAGPEAPEPTLLPSWWEMAAVQLVLALVVIGIWRGRRLGPILTEPLPVRVRASETVEGHGRLYFRIGARGRAADALRSATRDRLGRAFGHGGDSAQLSDVVAARTGRDAQQVRNLLAGAAPATDSELNDLADDLDQLEQEARRL